MISGASCWNQSVQQGMSLVRVGDRDVYAFDAAEPTLYAQLAATAARTKQTSTTKTDRRPDCVTEIRMGNSVLTVSGFFKQGATDTAADKMIKV